MIQSVLIEQGPIGPVAVNHRRTRGHLRLDLGTVHLIGNPQRDSTGAAQLSVSACVGVSATACVWFRNAQSVESVVCLSTSSKQLSARGLCYSADIWRLSQTLL